MIEEIKKGFIQEAKQNLDRVEEELEGLGSGGDSQQMVESVFLTMHSLKGSGPMFGFEIFGEIALPIERTYYSIRKGDLSLTAEIVQKTSEIVRFFKVLLSSGSTEMNLKEEALVEFFKCLGLQQKSI